MLLVLTYSEDRTFDRLQDYLTVPFFRFNIDLRKHYRWNITGDGYWFADPTGRSCEEREVSAVYLRKLIFDPPYIDVPAGGSEESWHREQLMEMILGIRDLAYAEGKLALVEPSRAVSKVRQMRTAAKYFPVPSWDAFHGQSRLSNPVVVKSFKPVPVGNGANVMVRRTDVTRLSPSFGWLVQQAIQASHDVTVVFVNGRLFVYEAPRTFEGDDVRLADLTREPAWAQISLTPQQQNGVCELMAELGLKFGRLDFLRAEDKLWFLEVNPNGQWGWLDFDGDGRLYQAIAGELERVALRCSHAVSLEPQ